MSSKVAMLLLVSLAVVAVNGQGNQCVPLGGRLLSICDAELSFLREIYPLDSTAPPTAAQVQQVTDTKPADLPTEACCTAVKAFDGARCPCDASIPTLLGTLGLSTTSTGLQGVTSFTGPLCKFTPVTC
ncbi:hypothetical protein F751_0021 [Auxenochlorella protothecoides]|uniref:Bifunctional inhibitor/plant lipid transfer protein/seed storage helical domain-containing protein n=1 Tax=Auxenochlorella protothecoides TaxID=3075 RepID=A0A087S9W7_AUXPR|nr:hypothetical protein F751_0021 [Auxenochlorella protothecoides]KFM22521.1 hypothetical protein F751_0021 [Auxenochlorella protothecoides]RMZ52927.1 hypothetical protein APUTEX25_001046 [Auxenochlorella protothecoides]|eukprot:RMZ52927.1 hypothetical protein APUTEX25_001046 [Auxenochlorella protothecoides]